MSAQILIFDFGSQYTQLIARRVRELNVYCEIYPFDQIPPIHEDVKGIILSGSPYSVQDSHHPDIDFSRFPSVPLLGICYGAQLMIHRDGGEVEKSHNREYGKAHLNLTNSPNDLLEKNFHNEPVWMSHADTISSLPGGYEKIASTESVEIVAFRHTRKPWYGIQFHPEVTHTTQGQKILQNFVMKICCCDGDWTPDHFVEKTVQALVDMLGADKVIMALSGGVDSTVAAVLIHRAIGKNLCCVFVDNGLLRKGEFIQVLASYQKMGLHVKGVSAEAQFYNALQGLTDAEAKRKAIGKTFIEIFEEQSSLLSDIKWLAQGTIYPDIIESKSVKGPSAVIKSHHNVGGLPDNMKLRIVEPLNTLFKDEVREVGAALEIPRSILTRHPFPGPGLGIRVIGEVTVERVTMLQEADAIFIQTLRDFGLYNKVWQAATILLPIRSVGVMGDERTYEHVVALRAVVSVDGMTANWAPLPHDFLNKVSSSIINKVKGVNRVVYDVSSKPPSTIEWE